MLGGKSCWLCRGESLEGELALPPLSVERSDLTLQAGGSMVITEIPGPPASFPTTECSVAVS